MSAPVKSPSSPRPTREVRVDRLRDLMLRAAQEQAATTKGGAK